LSEGRSPVPPSGWQPGEVIGRYRIEALLGVGGMGEVWRAWDTSLRRPVALKRLPPGAAVDPERGARFLREARALAALDSPGIVSLFAAENIEEPDPSLDSYLVMELVEGEPLDAFLCRRGALPFDEAMGLFRQLARALSDAHRAGVIHRDLKPANVLRRPDGRVVVIDFGLALLAEGGERGGRLTKTGMVAGTASYMAPEQARGEPLSPAADVWAAGIVLWEMLAGAHPFAGGSVLEQLAAVLRDPVPPIEVARPDAPQAISRVLGACLAKASEARPRDGEALLALLPQDYVPLVAGSQPLLAPEVLAEARAHEPLTRRGAHAALAAALLGVVAVTWVSWRAIGPALPGPFPAPKSADSLFDALVADLPVGERSGGVRSSGTSWVHGFGPVLWARRSPESMLRPESPVTPGHPPPGLDGDVRVLFDGAGRVVFWDWWPASAAGVPGQLERLAERAGAIPPLVPTATPSRPFRGGALRGLVDARGEKFVVARRPGQVLRFAKDGIEPPGPETNLLAPPENAFWLVLFAAVVALLVRNRRSSSWDLRGAAAFGVANAALQLLKVVFNPVTISSGIWLSVLLESLGHGILCGAAYAAFEPFVRRAWPGALASWARVVTLRRADEQVGRELLVGTAALLPAALALLAASFLPGRPFAERWSFAAFFGHQETGLRLFILLDLLQLCVFLAAIGLLLAVPLLSLVRRPALALPAALLAVAVLFLGASPAAPAGAVAVTAFAALLVGTVYAGGLVALTTLLGATALGLTSIPLRAGSWAVPGSLSGPLIAALLALLGWWLAVRRARRATGDAKTVNVAALVGSR
jgi:hypothetical protein